MGRFLVSLICCGLQILWDGILSTCISLVGQNNVNSEITITLPIVVLTLKGQCHEVFFSGFSFSQNDENMISGNWFMEKSEETISRHFPF
jgi:hypothetical protein